jgi:hypothetical protein
VSTSGGEPKGSYLAGVLSAPLPRVNGGAGTKIGLQLGTVEALSRGARGRYDQAMTVTIQLPADISAALGERWDDVPRRALEAIAIEGYRTGALSEGQVRRVLGLETRFQVHAMLKEHHVPLR